MSLVDKLSSFLLNFFLKQKLTSKSYSNKKIESFSRFTNRVKKVFSEFDNSHKRIIAVSSGGPISILMGHVMGLNIKNSVRFYVCS